MRAGLFVFTLGLMASAPLMAAKPTREQALYDQMNTLVKTYQQAQAQYEAGDDSKLPAMNKAIEDLEDVANLCFKLKSCSKTQIISSYEQLIKRHDIPVGTRLPSPASLPALGTTVKLLGPRQFELLVQYNEPMQAAIANWLTVNRAFFMDSWENYQYMRYLMAPEYERQGLPEALLFGMMTKESGGKVHSTSKAGASGPLQFMPATARRFGIGMGEGYDMRFDPQFAARANAEYMNERFTELNKSLEMAIAGYNGGEGRARRIYGQYGGDFWQERVYKEWPAETRDYVPAVLAAAWLFLHAEDYGLTLPKLDYTPATFALQRASSINELTICLGNPHNQFGWFRVLRNLNPHYEPAQYIAQGTMLRAPKKLVESYQANCLGGPRAEMARTLVQARKTPVFATPIYDQPAIASAENSMPANPDALATGNANGSPDSPKHNGKYTVQRGETLMMIMRRFDCDLRRLISENDLSPPDYVIRPGQDIKLAGCKK
jgi:membrane-bound lytic murein transglycosylase D